MTAKTNELIEKQTRELNDSMRRDIFNPALGTLIFTAGVAALMDSDRFALLDKVRCFEDFDEGNDPYHEHDFGAIDFKGGLYFWKFDYYDKAMRGHSPDKSSAAKTQRVLTIMQASEY